MTNKEIMDIAMQQSAYDTNAKVSDFLQDTNVFVKSGVGPLARKYYKEPIACNFVSYGSNVVASVKDEFKAINEQISNFAQTYPTNLKASSNEALLFMRRYRFANCSCFSCCFKDAYPSSNVQ